MELLILLALGVVVFFLLFGAWARIVGMRSNVTLEILVCLLSAYSIVEIVRRVFLGWS